MKPKPVLQFLKRLLIRSLKLAGFLLVIVILGLLVAAILSRSHLDLAHWHKRVPAGEFEAKLFGDALSFKEYLELEDKLFAQVPQYYTSPKRVSGNAPPFGRYFKDSRVNPATHPQNFNRTYELVPKNSRGGVLLLHGLSDSPYSMRRLGEFFYEQNFYVLNFRVPGHGIVPSGMLNVSWFDWAAAVSIAARKVSEVIGPEKPFYIAGYSNGGTLALNYATKTLLLKEQGREPDGLFLFSPAVGVSEFARASNWHKLFSWIPSLEKSKWLDLFPEYDPYKFNSFPKNAGAQIYYLSVALRANIEILKRQGKIKKLSPILTFQSIVDATVIGEALITKLYSQLDDNGSELVIFDINHDEGLDAFFKIDTIPLLKELEDRDDLSYRLSILTNSSDGTGMVVREQNAFSADVTETALNISWPKRVFSLSHVAIPFAANDPFYGDPEQGGATLAPLGALAPRGERNVLRISAAQLLRLRYNPFFSFMEDKIEASLVEQEHPFLAKEEG